MKSLGFKRDGVEWVDLEIPFSEVLRGSCEEDIREYGSRCGVDVRRYGGDEDRLIFWVQGPRIKTEPR